MNNHVAFIVCAFLLAVVAIAAFIVASDRLAGRRDRQPGAHRRAEVPFRDSSDEADPDGSGFVADLRGEPNRFPSLLAAPEPVPSSPPPSPEPAPVPPVPSLGSLAAAPVPVPVAVPLEPLPHTVTWTPPSDDNEGKEDLPPQAARAPRAQLPEARLIVPSKPTPDVMRRLRDALVALEPPAAKAPEPGASLAELVRSAPPVPAEPPARPVPAADETGALAFAAVMELGDVEEFVRRTFAEADAGVAAVVAEVLGSGDGEPHFAGASLTGLPEGGWDWHAPLLQPGGYRRAAGAQEDGAA